MNRCVRPVFPRRVSTEGRLTGLVLLALLMAGGPCSVYAEGMYEEGSPGLFGDSPSILPDLLFPGLSDTEEDVPGGIDLLSGTLPSPFLSAETLELLRNALEEARNGTADTPVPESGAAVPAPSSPEAPVAPVSPAAGAAPAAPPKSVSAPEASTGAAGGGSAPEKAGSDVQPVPRASAPASSPAAAPSAAAAPAPKAEVPAIPSGSSPADGGSSSAPRESSSRELRIRTGDEATVSLEGAGWIYLGELSGKSGIVFRKRDSGAEKADFSFLAKEPGAYTLGFQRQDLSSGTLFRETVAVTVADTVAAAPSAPATSAAPAASAPETAAESAGTDTSTERAPSTGARSGGPIVLAPASPEAETQAQSAGALDAPEAGAASAGPTVEALLASGREAEAVTALERFLAENPGSPKCEETLFRLAELYEKNTSVRNLKKSVAYYDRLLEQYPFTLYRERAETRRTYLTRHFFEIR